MPVLAHVLMVNVCDLKKVSSFEKPIHVGLNPVTFQPVRLVKVQNGRKIVFD